ncbi:hypothetical protein [Carnobacterium inhibens]|uniref:Uncharacterized protein n=1 Tax=Carnobacterium inhibens subsp. gilichinskyi TaxID=1266845 RepID=U5SDA1_9LACT|nr:hypothetical protein [Carnobacterium inhibens]AGY81832.1 hypothetical protein Q783_06095 [Carnobacterium inhibens subsp. gilichinskyi]MCM3512368.1 hypothetical protein [Carnobacterium inhibens]
MKNYKKILGYVLILVAVLLLVRLPNMVYPMPDEDGMDINLYILEAVLNISRYVVLSIFSFVLGIKLAFKN